MDLNAESCTHPQMRDTDGVGSDGGVDPASATADGADGVEDGPESPHPASPWTSTSSPIPPNILMDPSRGNEDGISSCL
jgi:hypothetical protein